jgi:hypothetical protein
MASPICSWCSRRWSWRHVKVTDRHTAISCPCAQDLADTHFPDVAKIVLLQDNLNTHKPASLYEAFPARRASSSSAEWHYTPKHGSWLNMANRTRRTRVAMSDRRIADKQILAHEVTAWQTTATSTTPSRLAIHNRQRPRQAEETVPQFE